MTKQYIHQLADTILDLQTRNEAIEFLEGILTPSELVDISQRLQIVILLKRGISQREIASKLGVGIATVTRGSKELQNGRFTQIPWRTSHNRRRG